MLLSVGSRLQLMATFCIILRVMYLSARPADSATVTDDDFFDLLSKEAGTVVNEHVVISLFRQTVAGSRKDSPVMSWKLEA